MNCPKCSTKMRDVQVVGMGNTLERDIGAAIHTGCQCPNCAKWIEPEMSVFKERITREQHRCLRNQGRDEVCGNIKAIKTYLAMGFPCTKIVKHLRMKLSPTTLIRHLNSMNVKEWHDRSVKNA